MISSFQAFCQARAPVAGLEPATEKLPQIQGGFAIRYTTDAPRERRRRRRGRRRRRRRRKKVNQEREQEEEEEDADGKEETEGEEDTKKSQNE
ncbi:hypothetical protein PoB_000083700 [Plakobranchus ocellatus]|uniref:Uncharacterized protein n=1 Tax=Plakobranchus ocellatus TaxID=259542 RepID=A0AAV3XWV8_9GAST|nr:hypothetical protein PoB_000083700 [Plakobranchus ocellatus]